MVDKNAQQPTPDNGDSTVIARYSILEKLGEGAFADVVKAYDTRLKRVVAVKILKRNAITMYPDRVREIEERFMREAEAGARMGIHPNVVSVFDIIHHDDRTMHLILDYIVGGNLARRIQEGPIPLEDALRWTADVARGLHAAHEAGIIHRDVKPANIFLAGDGRALIGDFGIAQIDTLSHRTSTFAHHPGTPLYMSPEQTQSTGYIRPSSDQFSLGLVLFEMLVRAPYKRFEPDHAATLMASQPEYVKYLVSRMIAVEPRDRYPSMADVVLAVRAIERSLEEGSAPETAPPGTPPPEQPGTGSRLDLTAIAAPPGPPPPPHDSSPMLSTPLHRRAVIVALGSLVVTTASGGLWLGRRSARGGAAVIAPPAATTAPAINVSAPSVSTPGGAVPANTPVPPVATSVPRPTALAVSGATLSTLTGHTDTLMSIAFTSDGKTLATGSLDGTARLWRASDGTSLHGGLSHPGGVRSVAFSRDGNLLATGALDNQVRLWNPVNGGFVRAIPGHTGPVYGVAFSPDGQMVASGSGDKTIRLWRVSDGSLVRPPIPAHVDVVFGVAFSPDGQTIASASADKTIKLWRVSDTASTPTPVQTFQGHADNVNGVAFSLDGKMIASVSADKKAILWDVSTGKTIHDHLMHPGVAYSVAFAPNGKYLATGSDDKTVRLWGTADGAPIGMLDGHTSSIRGVTFAPDGMTLASASADKTGRIWSLK